MKPLSCLYFVTTKGVFVRSDATAIFEGGVYFTGEP